MKQNLPSYRPSGTNLNNVRAPITSSSIRRTHVLQRAAGKLFFQVRMGLAKDEGRVEQKRELPTRMGFEPTRAEHIGLAVQRLNHSATRAHKFISVYFTLKQFENY